MWRELVTCLKIPGICAHNNLAERLLRDNVIMRLAKTKWQQKRAMRKIKKILSRYKLATRYQKTFAGKTSDIIAYPGYKLCPDGSIGISSESTRRMKLKLLRLKEQGSSPEKIRSYLRRRQAASRPPTGRFDLKAGGKTGFQIVK
ncbi:MAG: hypothetical protein NTZ78_02660 [Candidatus Aureabacteria bacterium]|nr:hypothetical protein [Candidatus Auribacterota bacterium]